MSASKRWRHLARRVGLGLVLAGAGCSEAPRGLAATRSGSGPQVRFDFFADPLPDIPFPNDIATRPDDSTPTGLRLNVSLRGKTAQERFVRSKINELDGFGTYAPITVAFDQGLDVGNILARHRDNRSTADDAVFVVNIDPDSPAYGEMSPLDLGRGFFPAISPENAIYFPEDPREGTVSVLYETIDEDLNGNGRLDIGEDSDNDGRLDRPNVWPTGVRPEDGLLTFYERQSNTLIIRPIKPLLEQTEYAVVLTKRLTGENGAPVRSPFEFVNHTDQTSQLRRLEGIFAQWGEAGGDLGVEDVAFAWSFTTQSVTRDMVAIREGLYGEGPLAWLAEQVEPAPTPAEANTNPSIASPYILDSEVLQLIVSLAFADLFGITNDQVTAVSEDLEAVDYIVQGDYTSPDFLKSDDPLYLQTFDVDVGRGEARVQPTRIPYLLMVPKATAEHQPPFPVAVYSHGFGQARIEPLAFGAILAKYGIASIGIDTWGHGINLPPADAATVLELGNALNVQPFLEKMLEGRARDEDGDGRVDSGSDMFSAYAFHTRDTMRQSAVDHLQLIRMLKGFDGSSTWAADADGDGNDDLAGDFNGDGVIDVGGPDRPYYFWGSSMGGLMSGLVSPLEPAVIATAPVAGGGGLSSFARRSRQESVINNTVMTVLGPIIVGRPDDGGRTRLTYHWAQANKLREVPLGSLELRPGQRVRVTNTTLDDVREVRVLPDGTFVAHMQADVGDRFEIEAFSQGGTSLGRIETWPEDVYLRFDDPPMYLAGEPLQTPNEGWGYHRGSPEFRRLIGLGQMALESGDPINYQRHMFEQPLDIAPEGPVDTNLLVIATVGDPMNPSDVHVNAATAAGIFDLDEIDPRYESSAVDWLIENWVLEGVCGFDRFPPNASGEEVLFDPDALDRLPGMGADTNGFDAPKPEPGKELRQTIETGQGQSGMRYGHMLPCGKHSFFLTDPSNAFNVDAYLNSLAGYYFATEGKVILDDACHEDSSCALP